MMGRPVRVISLVLRLNGDREAARNLADAAHYLSMLHGHHPGVIELASSKTAIPVSRSWLDQAEQGFARERLFLSHLTVAAGRFPARLVMTRAKPLC